ncbi:STAS domain-containing protein [Catellatospora methionotrophica]|uniref:STAS domain-containing protein n=1 Tax=Catellatospora methionotrophica TaxID=121620 RepID=UPI0033FC6DD8
MSDLAQIVVATHRDRPLVRISGELDMSNVPALDPRLRAGIGDAPAVYVDLTEVAFLDSQALSMLQRLADDLTRTGTALTVIAPPSGVAGSLLALTGMDRDLDVRPTLP